jgi:hypothetical protein
MFEGNVMKRNEDIGELGGGVGWTGVKGDGTGHENVVLNSQTVIMFVMKRKKS